MHFVSFFHLLSHALFKSCLFMQVGYLIHRSFGQQDGRFYGGHGGLSFFMQLQLLVTLFCLCGLVFTSGMVRKDLILEFFFVNYYCFFLFLLFVFSIFLTFCYSYRLWCSFFLNFSKVVFVVRERLLVNFLSLFLIFFSVVFMYWLRVNLVCLPALVLFIDFYFPLFYLILFFVVCFFSFKFLIKELIYKFFVDYYNKYLLEGWFLNVKFFDLGLMKFGNLIFFFFNYFGKFSGLIISSFRYNSLLVLIFFIFIFF